MKGDVVWGLKGIADALECSIHTLRRLLKEGLPVRILGRGRGRRYVARRSALLRWLERDSS